MKACPKCQEPKQEAFPGTITFMQTPDNPAWSFNPDGHGANVDKKHMPDHHVKHFETSLYEKLNVALLRNMPKGLLADLQERANGGGENSKTADILLHILWNPMNRQKVVPGCSHQYEDLSRLINELVASHGPESGG